ncbi:MAG: hypothetical protein KC620_13830, partial [Myxococcales bacterium]|nr:hypothetical protein [Myxococcales bacterium]
AAARDGQPLRLGADVSAGVGPLDVRGEVAVSHGGSPVRYAYDPEADEPVTEEDRSDDWIHQEVVGVEWGIAYGDQDTLYLTAEYFHNDAGYGDEAVYPALIARGGMTPLYTGRHYAGVAVALPAPGTWDDTTFLLSGLGNLSDRSFLARFDYQITLLTKLRLYCYASVHLGEGELALSAEVPADLFTDDVRPLVPQGLSLEAALVDLGVWLSLDL